jgi:YD repeat-containing protein
MTLYGSLLRLGIGHTFVLTREVEISANRMTLSWIAEGRRKRWIFQRNP